MSQTKIEPAVRTAIFDAHQHPRKAHLFQCDGCRRYFSRTALQVDHIRPEAESFPEDRSDPDNLQLLCAAKGSTWLTSCHKAKTRREHQRRAALNRLPRPWNRILAASGGAMACGGASWYTFQGETASAQQWAAWSVAVTAALLITKMVKNRFDRRRPRRIELPKPEPVIENVPATGVETLDTDRVVEAAREILGQKGDVFVSDTHGLASFTLNYPGTGFNDHEGEKKFSLQEKITAKIGDRWIVEWETSSDRAAFIRRPPLPKKVHHPGLGPDRKWYELPVADGATFDLHITPHILIAGETMSGKTAMMRAMIIAACDSARREGNIKVNLADPKKIEMMGFQGWEGIGRIITEPEDLWAFAFAQKREMDRRYSLVNQKRAKMQDFERIINFWDEQEEFYNAMLDLWQSGEKDEFGEPYKKPGERTPGAVRALARILAMSRKCNMHNIIGTQSPDALIFGKSGVRQNMPGRASVGALDGIRAGWLYGDSSIGRDIPSNAKGRATIQLGDGKPFEMQTWWVPDAADGDAHYDNVEEDWSTLLRLGMPTTYVPDNFKHLLEAV